MKQKLRPYQVDMLKCAAVLLVTLFAAVQPWSPVLRVMGIVASLVAGLVLIGTAVKVANAKRLLQREIARFASGDAVLEGGLFINGQAIDFNTFGTSVAGADIQGNTLRVAYRFAAKGNKRHREIAELPFAPDELEKAQAALDALGLPPIPAEENETTAPVQATPLPETTPAETPTEPEPHGKE